MPLPLVELALNKTLATAAEAPDRCPGVILSFADRLLRVFGSAIPEPSRPSKTRFAERVEKWRTRIKAEESPEGLEAIATEVLTECTAHADRFHEDLEQREREVTDLMGVLREVIEALRGDS